MPALHREDGSAVAMDAERPAALGGGVSADTALAGGGLLRGAGGRLARGTALGGWRLAAQPNRPLPSSTAGRCAPRPRAASAPAMMAASARKDRNSTWRLIRWGICSRFM